MLERQNGGPRRLFSGQISEQVIHFFLAGLLALLPLIVFDRIKGTFAGVGVDISYKTWARVLAALWVGLLAVPTVRAQLPYRPHRADLPLVLFVVAAVFSVLLGGGHWGDVRNLLAAVGLGFLTRALFAPRASRALFIHYLGGLIVLILLRELVIHPDLLPPREAARYLLVTGNPNVLGFIFSMAAPAFLAEAMTARSMRRAWSVFYYCAAAVGTLLTFSRTAAVGLVFGTAIVGLAGSRRRRTFVLGALGLFAFLAVQRPDTWLTHRAPGDADRLRIMRTSLSLATEAPLLGIGFGINNLKRRFPERYELLYGEQLFRYHSMNQIVDLLVGTGVIGTLLAGWWVTWLGSDALKRLRVAHHDHQKLRAAGSVAVLAAVAAMSLADTPLYHGKLVPILFLLIGYGQLEPLDRSPPGGHR